MSQAGGGARARGAQARVRVVVSLSWLVARVVDVSRRASYSFGQPRTGNDAFAQYAARQLAAAGATAVFRVVHNRDPVAHVPPEGPPYDYAHLPQEIFYSESMTSYATCDPNNGEDRELAARR